MYIVKKIEVKGFGKNEFTDVDFMRGLTSFEQKTTKTQEGMLTTTSLVFFTKEDASVFASPAIYRITFDNFLVTIGTAHIPASAEIDHSVRSRVSITYDSLSFI